MGSHAGTEARFVGVFDFRWLVSLFHDVSSEFYELCLKIIETFLCVGKHIYAHTLKSQLFEVWCFPQQNRGFAYLLIITQNLLLIIVDSFWFIRFYRMFLLAKGC